VDQAAENGAAQKASVAEDVKHVASSATAMAGGAKEGAAPKAAQALARAPSAKGPAGEIQEAVTASADGAKEGAALKAAQTSAQTENTFKQASGIRTYPLYLFYNADTYTHTCTHTHIRNARTILTPLHAREHPNPCLGDQSLKEMANNARLPEITASTSPTSLTKKASDKPNLQNSSSVQRAPPPASAGANTTAMMRRCV